ncbi:MAG: HAD hydrolase family protein [Elusimicrobia bacterium]|nr:HAD hydrolase family protein [Elusimicrobiota bacterium]MDE2313233.1 HAD hydrolase family protein [Elusimicrobiota bacterium]
MPKLSRSRLRNAAKRVKLALMDVDGVLTNGLIYHFVDSAGGLVEFKGMHSQDSIALTWLAQAGVKTGFISGRQSAGTQKRLEMLQASYIYQGRLDKVAVLEEIGRKSGVPLRDTLYMGDDLPDLPVLKRVGLAAAPSNARPEVKTAARWITKARGGAGAVREVVETILRAQGRWEELLAQFH